MDSEVLITIIAASATVISVLTYLAKKQFDGILSGIKENRDNLQQETKKLDESMDNRLKELKQKLDDRIDNVELRARKETRDVERQLHELKENLPFVFVTREDFAKTMNGVEKSIFSIDSKIDRIMEKIGGEKE